MSNSQEEIRLLVNGCNGKMGRTIIDALQNNEEFQLVGKAGRNDNLSRMITSTNANIVVDFTHPSVAYKNAITILENGAFGIIGTTGLSEDQRNEIDHIARSKNLSILIAPNFCIGSVLMIKFAAEAAKYMPYVEIVEYHHNKKADAPSGTAIYSAEYINSTVGATKPPLVDSVDAMEITSQGAKIGNIRIHSIRLPGFLASQEIILGQNGHSLKIRHDSIDRESFLPGVLLAIRKISKMNGLIYGLEKLL
jgi:4-hydroxy-tetrahydrodipicolinate reductase